MDTHHPSRHQPGSRKRSRSPQRQEVVPAASKRQRSHSPHRQRHHHHHGEKLSKAKLPFRSHHLHKHDFDDYKAVFADYLDLQKQLDIDQLSEDEVRGRWKSFLNKWNRGELAEGWYDPETKRKADERLSRKSYGSSVRGSVRDVGRASRKADAERLSDNEDDEGYGPSPPQTSHTAQIGPSIPSLQDLQDRQERAEEDQDARVADLRQERKDDRKLQRERQEDLAPCAEPGTRERQLEKKREKAASNRAFADAKEAGGGEEVGDGDLMGEDSVDSYKAKMKAMEKQKNEREIRKEEVLRARAAEREERMREHRRKEEKTMEMLRGIAEQRFGGGGGGRGGGGG